MRKIKLFIASFICAIALVFACVFGGVNAATGEYVDPVYDTNATNTGWTSEASTETVSTFDEVNYGQLPSGGKIISPTFTNAQTVVVTIYCGTRGSNSATAFKIRGYDGNTQVVEVTGYTPKSKVLGQACTKSDGTTGTFTLNGGDNVINKIEIYNSYSKGICFKSISYITTDAVAKTVESLSAINSTQYYVGQTVTSSGFTVTANYSDNTNGVLLPTKYTTTVKDSLNNEVSGALPSTGTYTATIILNEDNTISTTCNFTVSTYYTVNYYVENTLVKTDSEVQAGDNITYVPTSIPSGKYFEGWYTEATLDNKITSSYTVSSNLNLYANFDTIKNYVITEDEAPSLGSGLTVNGWAGSIFNLKEITVAENNGMTLPTNNKNTYRLETSSSSNTTRRTISFLAPYDGKLTLWVASSQSGRTMDVYEGAWGDKSVLSYEFTNDDKNKLLKKEVEIEEGKTYTIGGSNGYYIYGLFVKNNLADNVSAEMHTQYNNDNPALANKLRLIGYIDGIFDYSDISSITINATVTRSDSKVATLSYHITTLFQSFNDDYTATNGRYYAVVVIEGINTLINDTNYDYTLSTLSITITFTDNSSVTSTGFTSFKIGE